MASRQDKNFEVIIHWYPGHIAKTKRKLVEFLEFTDIVIYVLDSRLPIGTRLPEIEQAIKNKKIIVVLNKIDLADPAQTDKYLNILKKEFHIVVPANSQRGNGIESIKKYLENLRDKILLKKRISEVKAMVAGVPNCGKSSLINRLSSKKAVRVGKKAGITRAHQWVKINNGINLLDQPGIFFPKITNEEHGWKLAAIGSIKIDFLPVEEIAQKLIDYLIGINLIEETNSAEYIKSVAVKSGFYTNKSIDIRKSSLYLINRFQDGYFGKITLE